MKLYTSPLACSCAVQMILLELNLPCEIEYVNIYSQPHILINDGTPYTDVTLKGAVPALRLDSGEVLTEVGVILQYIADLRPGCGLLPMQGDMARYRVMEWLSYVGSDVHKTIGPLFNPTMPEQAKIIHRQNLHRRLLYIDQQLTTQLYLTGDTFTLADAYLFVMIGWKPYFKIDLSPYPNLKTFHERISARPSFCALLKLVTPVMEGMVLPKFPDVNLK